MRRFPFADSMETIWLFAGHLAGQGPQADRLRLPREQGWPDTLKDTIFPWDLELLARETILNSPTMGGDKSLGRWEEFAGAINFIRHIDNEISRQSDGEEVLRELHRIVHRQFHWQRPPSATSIMRYYKIFGGSELKPAVEQQTGIPIHKFYLLAFAVSGGFLRSAGINMATDYSAIGVSREESAAFFQKMSTTLPVLREQTRALQRYDDGWF